MKKPNAINYDNVIYNVVVWKDGNKIRYHTSSDFKGDDDLGLLVLHKLTDDARLIAEWMLEDKGTFHNEKKE